jgi:hydrogenase 3 maturation protease
MLVVLGVGNRLRGDDAIGCVVCDELRAGHDPIPLGESGSCSKPPDLLVVDCGDTPENYIQTVADRRPTRILVVDCCDFGAKPGEFRLFSRPEIERLSYGLLSTHTLPLTLTADMLSLETKATIELLGIQPQQIEFGTELSEPVRRALPELVEFVRSWTRER